MDTWIGGLAIDGRSREQVLEALDEIYGEADHGVVEESDVDAVGDERVLVVAGTKGWTSVFLERFEKDADLAVELSRRLTTTVICHRSVLYDAFEILAYREGEQIDQYRSCPDYFKSYDEADSTQEELDRSSGNPAALATAVTRIDAELLGQIYRDSRITNLEEQLEPKMPIAEALRALRRAFKIGTFEHGFDDLWYGVEDFRLDASFRAYLAPEEERPGFWDELRSRTAETRDRWLAPARKLRDRFDDLAARLKKPGENKAEPEPEPATAPVADSEAPAADATTSDS